MSAFFIIAVCMTAAALAFIVPTLRGKPIAGESRTQRDQVNLAVLRDQLRELERDLASSTIDSQAYDSARRELEQRVAEDVKPELPVQQAAARGSAQGIAVGVALVIAATALYAHLGTPAGLAPQASPRAFDPKDGNAAIDQLAQRLKNQPENAEGWTMLARSLNAMGRYADASRAYKNLNALVPGNAQLLTEHAGSAAMAQGASLQGEPEQILARALAAEPTNTKALSLSGSAAFERGDYGAAIALWKRVLALAPADSEIAQVANDNIKEAMAAAPTASQVAGTVELDPALRSELKDTDTVFVFARASDGPAFPLAVVRKQVRDLPFSFVLDDSMSMMPDVKLSGFPSLVVSARVSKSGNATPQAGDLEGSVSSVQPGAKDVKINISARRRL